MTLAGVLMASLCAAAPAGAQQVPAASATSALAAATTPGSALASAPAAPSALPASAPVAMQGPCLMLFGQGRNFDPDQPARNRRWDEANGAFSLAVREPLAAAGIPVVSVVLPVAATDVPGNLRGLVAEVKRRGCTRVLETAFFADDAAGLLIARIRLYPVLGALGPQAAGSEPRIGAMAQTQQKEFALDARVLERVDPSRLGRAMAEEALAQLAPTSVRRPAGP